MGGCWSEQEQVGDWREGCGDGSEQEQVEEGGDWREKECGDGRMQQGEEQQGGVLGRRWRCSRWWSSRCRAAAGWSWGCCGEEEDVVVIWELRRRRFRLEEQTSCQQEEEELCGRSCSDWR